MDFFVALIFMKENSTKKIGIRIKCMSLHCLVCLYISVKYIESLVDLDEIILKALLMACDLFLFFCV